MCGITGFFHRRGRPDGPWQARLERMTRTLTHRGPDDEGYHLDAHVGLGHRRLSIVDLATGRQPIGNETDDIWVIANAEIYNDPALRALLGQKGHRYRTGSDSESIVHAYEEWGTGCVEHLRGMFAFAIWDARRRRVVLARDRLGKKPLYYLVAANGDLVFGSELKALIAFPGVERALSLEALSDYLSLGYVPRDKCIVAAARKLLPGEILVADPDAIRLERYWSLRFADPADDAAAPQRIAELLRESVTLRLRSDVPCGALLSGGLDSSAVVGTMAAIAPAPIPTAAIGFLEPGYDERSAARLVASAFGTEHRDAVVTAEVSRTLDRLAWHYDEPFADASAVPTYQLSALARQRMTVALSGDGGDECFGGYRRYVFDLREHRVRDLLPRGWGRRVAGALGTLYPKGDYLPQFMRGKAFLGNVARTPWEAYLHSVSGVSEHDKQRLLCADVSRRMDGYRTADLFEQLYAGADGPDPLSRIQHVDFQTYLPDDILTKVDRASMAHGLEVRCPLLDHRLIEFTARLPARRKIAGGQTKAVFREAVRDLLPEHVLQRPKMGFAMPLGEWLRGPLRAVAEDLVLSRDVDHGLFDPAAVRAFWTQHQGGWRDRSRELWTVAMFNLWYRTFGSAAAITG